MEQLLKTLEIISQIAGIVLVIAGVGAVIAKKWVSERIKSYYQLNVGKELAEQAHGYSKDLEAQKGAIVQDLEKIRANIDIRRSIALKMADVRLEALRTFYIAFDSCVNKCTVWPTFSMDLRLKYLIEIAALIKTAQEQHRAAEIFLPHDLHSYISTCMVDAIGLVGEFHNENANVLRIDDPQIVPIRYKHVSILVQLRGLIFQPPNDI
jgi:hypothetical protein